MIKVQTKQNILLKKPEEKDYQLLKEKIDEFYEKDPYGKKAVVLWNLYNGCLDLISFDKDDHSQTIYVNDIQVYSKTNSLVIFELKDINDYDKIEDLMALFNLSTDNVVPKYFNLHLEGEIERTYKNTHTVRSNISQKDVVAYGMKVNRLILKEAFESISSFAVPLSFFSEYVERMQNFNNWFVNQLKANQIDDQIINYYLDYFNLATKNKFNTLASQVQNKMRFSRMIIDKNMKDWFVKEK